MTIKRILFASLLLFFMSCGKSQKEKIIGKWQGEKLENAIIDSFFVRSQRVIDTIGKNKTPDQNFEIYGTGNMDSMRHALQLQHDSAYTIQTNKIKSTSFVFHKDKVAYLVFDPKLGTDTVKWNFDDEGSLLLQDLSYERDGAIKRMGILLLNEAVLKLKIKNGQDSSILTFNHVTE